MGTYTINYNLFMPTVGEQGWGELVNGNFTTIDTTMKGLSNSIGNLEADMDAVEERVTVLEAGEFENITVTENVTGNVKGLLFVPGVVQLEGDVVYAKAESFTANCSNTVTHTVANYSIVYTTPQKHTYGVFTRFVDLTGETNPTLDTRVATFQNTGGNIRPSVTIKDTTDNTTKTYTLANYGGTATHELIVGRTYTFSGNYVSVTIPAAPTYYVKYLEP